MEKMVDRDYCEELNVACIVTLSVRDVASRVVRLETSSAASNRD
jgi:hypothetical protein